MEKFGSGDCDTFWRKNGEKKRAGRVLLKLFSLLFGEEEVAKRPRARNRHFGLGKLSLTHNSFVLWR